jgi:PAS domain S-box-containing protein
MKNVVPLESHKEIHCIDSNQFNDQIHSNKPDPVNFPSTAEVFQAVFDNSYHASCIGDSHGKTLKANETACKIFGYTKDEMIELTTKEIFDTSDESYASFLSERESRGKAKAEVSGIRKNGERFLCEISSLLFIDDNGEKRTLNTLHDISKKDTDLIYEFN